MTFSQEIIKLNFLSHTKYSYKSREQDIDTKTCGNILGKNTSKYVYAAVRTLVYPRMANLRFMYCHNYSILDLFSI